MIEAMKQLIEDCISMMEYHVEQTRPIHTTTVAIQAAKEALQAIAEAEHVEPVSGFFSREAMKEHSDFHPQPKAEKQEPVATVTGVYGGRFIVEPTNSAMVLPVNMALYTQPQRRKQVKFPTMLRKMWSGGEVQAWLDENVNKE